MRRAWSLWKAVRRLLKYSEDIPAWNEQDIDTLRTFLNRTGTGTRLRNGVVTHILNQSQEAIANGNSEFDAGTIHGMKLLWVFIETCASVEVAPQDDQQQNPLA